MFLNPYLSITDLERMTRKACKKNDLDIRREGDTLIIYDDRAEVGTVDVRVYRRSFDMTIGDAYGHRVLRTVTFKGKNQKRRLKEYLNRLIPNMNNQLVPAGHKVNKKFSNILSAISDPYDGDFRPLMECDFY